MTTRKILEDKALVLSAKSLRKDGKFYAEDLAAMKAGLKRKTTAQLKQTISNLTAIDNVSELEIRVHSQL